MISTDEIGRWISDDRNHGIHINSGVLSDMCCEIIRLRAQVAAAEKLRAAASELHRDMMDRAQVNVDVIAGKEYRIVNAGNSAWMGFCGALDDYEAAR